MSCTNQDREVWQGTGTVHHNTVEEIKCTFLIDMQDDIQKI